MPRPEKRAPSVMSGIANHAIVGTCGPPLRATLLAMMICEPAQLASRAYSGRLARSMRVSARRKTTTAMASGSSVHQPSCGPQATSATASTAKTARRTGRRWRSMSSMRSRSTPSGKSHDPRSMIRLSAAERAP